MHVYIHRYLSRICFSPNKSIYVYIYIYIYMCTRIHVHIHLRCLAVYVYVCVYIYIYMYVHIVCVVVLVMPWSDGAASGDGVTLATPCSSRLHPDNQHTPVVPPYCVIYIYIYTYTRVCGGGVSDTVEWWCRQWCWCDIGLTLTIMAPPWQPLWLG